jgi:GNAT superfamily N-acetyltransferase
VNAQLKPQPAFARESCSDVLGEIAPLLEAHWAEIAYYPDIRVKVNYAAYFKFETHGVLRIYTIRVEGALVGYAIFQVNLNLHYGDSLQAQQDVLYLDPRYRQGRLGWRFIAWCDEQLRANGVQVVRHHQKLAHPALGKILHRLGYEPVDMLWTRRLDGI